MTPEQPVEPQDLSGPVAAALLLFWEDPTDRALAGWTPYQSVVSRMNECQVIAWLVSQLGS